MTQAKRLALVALAVVASCAGSLAAAADASPRERLAAARARDLERPCSVHRLGGDGAEVSCRPVTRADATPARAAAAEALRNARP